MSCAAPPAVARKKFQTGIRTLIHRDPPGTVRYFERQCAWFIRWRAPCRSAFAVYVRPFPRVDDGGWQIAAANGTSLNEAAVDALAEGSGMAGSRRKRRDLADIARTWKADKAVEAALADQDRVDEDLWR